VGVVLSTWVPGGARDGTQTMLKSTVKKTSRWLIRWSVGVAPGSCAAPNDPYCMNTKPGAFKVVQLGDKT